MEIEIPLNPIGRQEIHQLESILLFATLFRPEVIELIKDPAERLTWVDSLAVAAGAIAREKAGMTTSEIARELGRTEQTIRKHLKEESKAGRLVRETYELIKQGKLNDLIKTIESIERGGLKDMVAKEEYERLMSEHEQVETERLRKELDRLKVELEKVRRENKELERELAQAKVRLMEIRALESEREKLMQEKEELAKKVEELEPYKIKFEELKEKIEKLKEEIGKLLK